MARPPFLALSICCIGWTVVALGKLKLNANFIPSFAATTTSNNGNYNSHHNDQGVAATQPDAKGSSSGRSRFYPSRPLSTHFGIEALDINLNGESSLIYNHDFISQLKQDLVQHRAVLFRSQNLSGERQVNISKALGTIYRWKKHHPKSPHPDVLRISNNETEGITGVGRQGWHNDGTFLVSPFLYVTMYFPSVSEGGDTHFMPLKEFYDSLSAEEKEQYNQRWIRPSSGKKKTLIHPMVYKHPLRPNDEETMLLHSGKGTSWYSDDVVLNRTTAANGNHSDINGHHAANSPEGMKKMAQSSTIWDELTKRLHSKLGIIGLPMKWQQGDFMIFDNLAMGHYASPGTQEPSQDAGLRILHRTTILGDDDETDIILAKLDGRKSIFKILS